MKREYIEGHPFNSTKRRNIPWNREKVWFVRGAIRVDGIPEGYAVWGDNLEDVMEAFKSYLNPECNCVYRSDPKLCPVHAKEHESK